MLISGLIGFGTGLFVSGVILSILLYKTNAVQPDNHISTEQIKKDDLEELPVIPVIMEQTSRKSEPNIISTESGITKIEPETVEIIIDRRATALQIASLLEEKGVVSDSDALLAYIVSQGASRKLQHGSKIFTLGSDNETTLKVLTTYE